jgi:hypothetical protein
MMKSRKKQDVYTPEQVCVSLLHLPVKVCHLLDATRPTDTKHTILSFVTLQYKGRQTHEENPSASRVTIYIPPRPIWSDPEISPASQRASTRAPEKPHPLTLPGAYLCPPGWVRRRRNRTANAWLSIIKGIVQPRLILSFWLLVFGTGTVKHWLWGWRWNNHNTNLVNEYAVR